MPDKVQLYCEYRKEADYINQELAEFDSAQLAHNEILTAYLLGNLNREMDTLSNYYHKISKEIDNEIAAYWETFERMYVSVFTLTSKN